MDTEMMLDDFRSAFKQTRESTSSSPSGIYYGCSIAACESEKLAEVDLLFMVTRFKLGMTLTQ